MPSLGLPNLRPVAVRGPLGPPLAFRRRVRPGAGEGAGRVPGGRLPCAGRVRPPLLPAGAGGGRGSRGTFGLQASAGERGLVRPPAGDVTPSVPNAYATAMSRGGYAVGLVVTSWEGRPTKVEGNRGHPASLGGTDAMLQAEVLELYDPSRARGFLREGRQLAEPGSSRNCRSSPGSREGRGRAPAVPARAHELSHARPSCAAASWRASPRPASTLRHGQRGRGPGGRRRWPSAGRSRSRRSLSDADVILSLDADFLVRDGEACGSPAGFAARREDPGRHEPALRGRGGHVGHRGGRRPPPAHAAGGGAALRPRGGLRARLHHGLRRSRSSGEAATGERARWPERSRRTSPGPRGVRSWRRAAPAGGGARPRPRAERRARQRGPYGGPTEARCSVDPWPGRPV